MEESEMREEVVCVEGQDLGGCVPVVDNLSSMLSCSTELEHAKVSNNGEEPSDSLLTLSKAGDTEFEEEITLEGQNIEELCEGNNVVIDKNVPVENVNCLEENESGVSQLQSDHNDILMEGDGQAVDVETQRIIITIEDGSTEEGIEGDLGEVMEKEDEIQSTLFQNIPCVACGCNCFIKAEPEDNPFILNSFELFTEMCSLLRIKTKDVRWASECERLPICDECRNQISFLLDLKRRLLEIERDYHSGVTEFKNMCRDSEGKFSESGIYSKDVRYHKIRKQFVNSLRGNVGRPKRSAVKELVEEKSLNQQNRTPPSRRSLRGHNNARIHDISGVSNCYPVVSGSSSDKSKADECHVKTEVASDDEFGVNDSLNLVQSSDLNSDYFNEYNEPRAETNPSIPVETCEQVAFKTVESKVKRKRGRKPGPKSAKNKIKEKRQKTSTVGSSLKVEKQRHPRLARTSSNIKKKELFETNDACINQHFSDADSEEEVVAVKKKRRGTQKNLRKSKDVDYEPDEQLIQEVEEDNGDDSLGKWWTDEERTRKDKTTGRCTFMSIAFEPLNDGSGKFTCMECEEIIAGSMLRKHTFKYHTTRFKCTECGRCEGGPAALRNHIRYFHREKKPKNECPICGKPVSSIKDRMLSHITTHYSEQEKEEAIARGEKLRFWKDRRNIQCAVCGKKFTSKKELERHNVSRHPKPEDTEMIKQFKELCPECGKLVDRHYMKVHRMRSHNITTDANLSVGTVLAHEPEANKRFICTLCDRRFYKNMELVRHKMSVHEKNYPFKCDLCPRSFLLKQQLQRHMNTHNNIRPYPCTHCPMAFFTNGNLTRHISTYHAEGANPKRKAYVRGGQSTNVVSKRHMPKVKDPPPPPPFIQQSSLPLPIDSIISNDLELKQDSNGSEEEAVRSKITVAEQQLSHKPPVQVQENDFIENLVLQSAMGATVPNSSSSLMQELFIRQQQHHHHPI